VFEYQFPQGFCTATTEQIMSRIPEARNSGMIRQVEDLCREMTEREEAGDPDAEAWFDDLLDSDFVIRRANGEFHGKRKFIRELKNGAGRGRVTELPVTILFETEVAVAWVAIAIGPRRFRNLQVFRQSSDPGRGKAGWILEMWNNTEIQAPPSAGPEVDVLEPGPGSGPPGARGIGSHLI